jgi:macrolide transport system ATP-binding/permease protein
MFRRRRRTSDFDAEIEAHLAHEADELRLEGLSEDQAYRKARVAFGNAQAARERFYLRSRVEWFDNFLRDVQFAFRQLGKNPGFGATAILILALLLVLQSLLS